MNEDDKSGKLNEMKELESLIHKWFRDTLMVVTRVEW